MYKKQKFYLHSYLNRTTLPFLSILFVIAYYFIYRDAYNELWRLIGLAIITLFLILVFILFIYYYRILDYLVFTNENIILCSIFRKNKFIKYADYIWHNGTYVSFFEKKQIIVFSPKNLGEVFSNVDTSRFGNCIYLNKIHVLYCNYDKELEDFLNEKIKTS